MHYITQKAITTEYQNNNLSYYHVLENHANHLTFMRNHYIKIIQLFRFTKENTQSCLYDDMRAEINLLSNRLELLKIISAQIEDKVLSDSLKAHKDLILNLTFELRTAKDFNYMVIYHYDRFLLSLNKSKNFINSQIRQIRKVQYSIYN